MSLHIRNGLGFDAHRFADESNPKPFFLALLNWDGNGIEGDSDGDVVAHALIDAMLSACSLGDIGTMFGVGKNSRGAGMHGDQMLRETVNRVRGEGFQLLSASVSVIGNRPKIGSRRDEAMRALSMACGCPVSLTATTTDGMGFTGRGEGIAAIATVLVQSEQ